ncbi:Glycosyltransferase, catalytic subunit of cellulose synthase and poly-beta-1,6-N-acetylglucosamine synthase [Prevotella communis]|jgi:cellulose synthase/poly-beta-1,6-N-acetylglucosamine synthase-like glycosyltransferase|uniref:Glycosyltransferase, catalytic subunit of cellulose synthase and poly-beta-1,6-N-acetylglucosamine synthase n=1 Tax=Prevotella communis TaxID=2913614 RepID=A0A1H0HMT0_9BACT|nr:glycosyltransferase family 2 protein [Prevotella communis]SDG71257.1 Glycosyltransferase, catalytic subunit of cellulose synthase and poly-beta-1,6-N-acetylglucosamine synthase [Prevotella communis]SDO20420.1 Glycosyltransferase, catalytic subunit of cellulose synthase and poly-beta-1,6-N-acetylglucosamine synthase [Prevotella communis]
MVITLKIIFWLCLALVVYTYVGYGAVLYIILKVKNIFFRRETTPILPLDPQLLPDVTLMICAYNEADVIEEKMQNIRALNYPQDKLCVMWVTDGSNDNSNELLQAYPEVKLVYSPERKGKAAAMQHGLQENKAEYVIFTDANTMLNADAIREIVRQFMKKNVSCVSGEKRVAARHAGQATAEGEGVYWKYESMLKRWDSELYSAMGAAGELFAVRMSHYLPAPSNALLDDFMMSMLILKDGHRIAYTNEAYATEYGSASTAEESKRKRRIAAGGLQSIWWLRSLMNPFAYPKVAFQYVSHRVLRWSITPLALFALFPLNLLLLFASGSLIYQLLFLLQLFFYLSALTGHILKVSGRRNKLLYIPCYFLFMNLNVFLGIGYLMSHKDSGTWEKARRG